MTSVGLVPGERADQVGLTDLQASRGATEKQPAERGLRHCKVIVARGGLAPGGRGEHIVKLYLDYVTSELYKSAGCIIASSAGVSASVRPPQFPSVEDVFDLVEGKAVVPHGC
jgi:hypothetical protein